jgi:hypothetical protein
METIALAVIQLNIQHKHPTHALYHALEINLNFVDLVMANIIVFTLEVIKNYINHPRKAMTP